jgi:hypothetical protein
MMPNPPPIILDVDAKQPGQQNDDVAASDWSPRSTGSEEQASVEAMVAEVYVSIDRAMHDRQKTKTFKLFLVRFLLEAQCCRILMRSILCAAVPVYGVSPSEHLEFVF